MDHGERIAKSEAEVDYIRETLVEIKGEQVRLRDHMDRGFAELRTEMAKKHALDDRHRHNVRYGNPRHDGQDGRNVLNRTTQRHQPGPHIKGIRGRLINLVQSRDS